MVLGEDPLEFFHEILKEADLVVVERGLLPGEDPDGSEFLVILCVHKEMLEGQATP